MEENSWIICGKIKLRFINAQKSSLEIIHERNGGHTFFAHTHIWYKGDSFLCLSVCVLENHE